MVDVVDRERFQRRCDELRRQGLSSELVELIEITGALDILELLEAVQFNDC